MRLTLILIFFVSSVVTLDHSEETCKYNKRHKLAKIICSDFNATPEMEIPIPDSNFEKLSFKNITGSLDLSNLTLNNLRFLVISHSRIDNCSLGHFPQLIFLNILKNSKFPHLTQDFLSPVKQINWLSLVSNNQTIDPDAFHFLKNLTWLHIQNQKLEHLTIDYFKENTKMQELVIRNCLLEEVDSDAFDKLTELEILSLNYNNLRFFQSGTFKNLIKLRILELHHNKLFISFDLNQFVGLDSLEIIGLPSNFLRRVEAHKLLEIFPNLKKLEMKKRDTRRGEVKELIRQVRGEGIDIIGTPHECQSTVTCNRV